MTDEKDLTWREKTTISILLFVAAIITPEHKDEIELLCQHIQYSKQTTCARGEMVDANDSQAASWE